MHFDEETPKVLPDAGIATEIRLDGARGVSWRPSQQKVVRSWGGMQPTQHAGPSRKSTEKVRLGTLRNGWDQSKAAF